MRRLSWSTSLSWICAESGSMTEQRSTVPRVAKIGPSKPAFASFGSSPEWSICAWVRMTASTSEAVKGNSR
ncbi:hypothetical protein D3C72_2057790 [compost metagenome]